MLYMVNLGTSVYTPITVPTWGHIAQMSKKIPNSNIVWASLEADRKAEYKQLLLDKDRVNVTLVALESPIL